MRVSVLAGCLTLLLVVAVTGTSDREDQRARKEVKMNEQIDRLKSELKALMADLNACYAGSQVVAIPGVLSEQPVESYDSWSAERRALRAVIKGLKTEIRKMEKSAEECQAELDSDVGCNGDSSLCTGEEFVCDSNNECKLDFNADCKGDLGACRADAYCDINNRCSWLKKLCNADSECTVKDAECFKGLCLCSPGFYYREGSASCIADCPGPDLSQKFLHYEGSAVHAVNLWAGEGLSLSACQDQCAHNFTQCLSFDYRTSTQSCYLKQDTPLTAGGNYVREDANFDYYQRACIL